ncbi:MAG: outer membrane beta-barrel protein [Bacteroidetes bacterium]|nr:outer membrane beta-barrel protein [Bacteroidota bacterium]
MSQSSNSNSGPGKNLDDLFRESIGKQEFTPSPGVWKSLNWKLLFKELIHFNFINVPKLALVSVSGGILVIASLTYWALQPAGKSLLPAGPVTQSQSVARPVTIQNQVGVASSEPLTLNEKQTINPPAREVKPVQPVSVPVKRNLTSGALIASNVKTGNSPSPSEPSPVPDPAFIKHESESTNKVPPSIIDLLDPLEFSNFDLSSAPDTISFIRSGEVFTYVHEKMPLPSFFSCNLGVAPEMALYNSNGATTTEFNYWVNAGIAYHYSRFSIRTGLGLGYTYDEGVYKMQYRSNDSVSFYKEVIGYYPDPVNPSKIIYITRNHAIYDSVTHIADDRTRNRYTYLQIPLLLGYNLFETSKFCLGFEVGPAVSFLISEKKAEPSIDIPNGRLIKLEDSSPSRLPTNWQLWVRLTIGYQFTKHWGLEINPYYKYFLTSPVQSTETGKPSTQAFGIDLGIQYHFGRKSIKK